jgi:chromosome segregation ATPase
MWRGIVIGISLAAVVVSVASGQTQRTPATLDDLVTEVRAMRGEMNRAASASIRAQLLTARMTLQELRLSTAAQQLANVRQQLADSRIRLAPSTDQIKPAMETNSQILAPLRYTVQQAQRRTQELRNEEAELMRLVESEEDRWVDFNTRLDELERSLSQGQGR